MYWDRISRMDRRIGADLLKFSRKSPPVRYESYVLAVNERKYDQPLTNQPHLKPDWDAKSGRPTRISPSQNFAFMS